MSNLKLNTSPHTERITLFTDIIVPAPIPKLFTYRVPYEYNELVQPGKRVIIQFGRKKILTGVINEVHELPPTSYEAKYLLDILDDQPSLLQPQLKLIEWCADYYMSTPGEVLTNMLPSGLKLSSESFVQLHPDFDPEQSVYEFTNKESMIIRVLNEKSLLNYQEISDIAELKNVYQLIKSLVTKDAVLLIEKVKEKYQPKKVKRIRLTKQYTNQSLLQEVFQNLEKNPKQTDVLLYYLRGIPVYNNPEHNVSGIEKSEVLHAGYSGSSLNTLIKNGIFEEFTQTVSRLDTRSIHTDTKIVLSDNQKDCFQEILELFQQKDVVLLHGVTGSGKTEIYIKLIEEAIEGGGQVLYMLPEIALTTQIVKRLAKVFGDKLGIYHSKYSDNERVEVWQHLLNKQYDVVVGVRSSVFLPFSNLSLIIVDEEHENSYKQFEPSPRYNARDTAIVLAQLHKAKTLLGSATPSFESYYNALEDKYGHVTLENRFGDAVLPEVRTANLTEGRKKKTLKGEFTEELIAELEKTIEFKKQAIIFKNRRGYSPFLSCDECAHVPKCQNCSVSLTYHMQGNMIRCHYCGYKEPAPRHCPSCGSNRIRTIGFGTEKIEDDLKLLIPAVNVERMDLDTTRSKYGYQQLIDGFEKGDIDILVGTQMVTKGLDFDHVQLVGVVDLDRMLHFPDFRSSERCFQLVTQVSGRAGRREHPGLVIIQTLDPYQAIIRHLISQDFVEFYRSEIGERAKFEYPPFFRLVKIIFKNRNHKIVEKAASKIAVELKNQLGRRVLGPKQPLIIKIRNQFHMEILVKFEKSKINLAKVKELLKDCVSGIRADRELKGTIVNFDVDPF